MKANHDSLAIGRKVINLEAESLRVLGGALDESFTKAVDFIYNSKQHIIVVGIGKSGHIGRKIAASFASMGTPAFFVHPSEAAHGDLGMITAGSAILGLSNSGESAEVNGVIQYAKSLGNQTIAITSGPQSTLAKCVDVCLVLPDEPEAGANKLAPTTSTTMTLAMGDALCVAVMEKRGFSAEDFGLRHPAGKLGFGLKRVGEYLETQTTMTPYVSPDAIISDVIFTIANGGKGCVGVVEGTRLKGIITDGDLRRALSSDIMSKTAADIMTKNPFVLSPEIRLKDVIAAFAERKIGNAFVIDDGGVIGLIDMKTLLASHQI